MNIFDKNKKEISGPINVVRMEGTINNIKKVIYLFMDWHEDVSTQTECINVFSKDLNKYLAENFHKLNGSSVLYDFFMEIRPTDILIPPNVGTEALIWKKKYIMQVIKFFATVFKYDYQKDIVGVSDIFKNIRLHYLDIRDYLKYHIIDYIVEADKLAKEFMYYHNVMIGPLSNIINMLQTAKTNLDKTIQIFKSNPKTKTKKQPIIKYYQGFEQETIERLVAKIKQSYKHDNVKNILVPFFDKYIKDLVTLSKKIDNTIQKLNNYGNKLRDSTDKLNKEPENEMYYYGPSSYAIRKIIMDIIDSTDYLYSTCINIFAKVTDIYMLRRFLDKDYITNAIVYSGAAHSETYISILVTKFNFKITHAAYLSVPNIDTLNKEVKIKTNKNNDITELFYPPILHQCSDITNFPDEFL
jgi:hypothetical protein